MELLKKILRLASRPAVLLSALLLALAMPATSVYGASSDEATRSVEIGEQMLGDALIVLSETFGVSVLVDQELVKGVAASPVSGRLTFDQALEAVLSDSGLRPRQTAAGTYLIVRSEESGSAPPLPESGSASGSARVAQIEDEIVVYGSRPGRYRADSAYSATATQQPLLDTPRTVHVVTEQVILDQQAQDLRDVVRNFSGVQATNISGGTTDSFIIRGFEVQNVLLDGFQLGRNTTRMQTPNIELVELVKGPNAILFGQSQPGGIINVVTKSPKVEPRRVITGQFDQFGRRELLFDATGPVDDEQRLLYRLVAAVEDTEVFRETDVPGEIKQTLVAPSVTWNLNGRHSLTGALEYTDSERYVDTGSVAYTDPVSGELIVADIPRKRRLGEHIDVRKTDDQYTFRLGYDGQIFDRWNLSADVNHQDGSHSTFNHQPVSASADGTLVRGQQQFLPEEKRTQLRVQVDGKLQLGATHHQLALGADHNVRKFGSEGSFGMTPNVINFFDPVYGLTEVDVSPVLVSDFNDKQTSFYAQDVIAIGDRWIVSAGLRVDDYRRDREIMFGTNLNNLSLDSKIETSPNAGVVFKPTENLSLYASYSESFDPNNPSVNIVTGDLVTLDPSEGKQYEVGVKGLLWNERVFATLSYFDLTRTNVRFGTDPVTQVALLNGEEASKGVELDVTVQFAEGLNLIFNYAYLDAEIVVGNNEGNRPVNTPRNTANLWLTYEFLQGPLRGFGIGGGASHKGEFFANSSNTLALDSFTTVDLTAFYYLPLSSRSQLRFQLGVRNLTDENYIRSGSTRSLDVGEPRNFHASVGFEF